MNWIFYIVLALVCVGLSYAKIKVRDAFLRELSTTLYKDYDANSYLEKLISLKAKFLINRKTRLFMSIEGYLLNNQLDEVINVFKYMDGLKLGMSKKIGLLKREVEVYMDAKMNDEAILANNKLQELSRSVNHATVNAIASELNDMVEINIHHNGELAEKMVNVAKASNSDLIKEIYYYRAAKCYYFKGNQEKTNKYLQKANSASKKTIFSKHIESCMQDQSNFLLK